jgi:hypothetical protein
MGGAAHSVTRELCERHSGSKADDLAIPLLYAGNYAKSAPDGETLGER